MRVHIFGVFADQAFAAAVAVGAHQVIGAAAIAVAHQFAVDVEIGLAHVADDRTPTVIADVVEHRVHAAAVPGGVGNATAQAGWAAAAARCGCAAGRGRGGRGCTGAGRDLSLIHISEPTRPY